jgi:hypothetical protein
MASLQVPAPRQDEFRSYALAALLAAFAFRAQDILALLKVQPAGVDYSCFWAGAKALAHKEHLYDFLYVTGLQGWPMGPDMVRPFIYPPSALLAFAPFAALPYWAGYATWTAATFALFAWAAWRVGSPWWIVLFPVVLLVAVCGQVTFLIGGLIALALTLRGRPIVAGVLFGLAAAVKPQLLIFAPVALAADRQWRTLLAAGLAGLLAVAVSAMIWGVDLWIRWPEALAGFQHDVIFGDRRLVADAITPFATLSMFGLPGAWAFILAPAATVMVWRTFRRTKVVADRLIVLVGAALLISPYAMNYEAALLAPGVAAYLVRTQDRLWPHYAAMAVLFTMGLVWGCTPVLAALALPASTWLRRSPIGRDYAWRRTAKSARSWSAGRQLLEP